MHLAAGASFARVRSLQRYPDLCLLYEWRNEKKARKKGTERVKMPQAWPTGTSEHFSKAAKRNFPPSFSFIRQSVTAGSHSVHLAAAIPFKCYSSTAWHICAKVLRKLNGRWTGGIWRDSKELKIYKKKNNCLRRMRDTGPWQVCFSRCFNAESDFRLSSAPTTSTQTISPLRR